MENTQSSHLIFKSNFQKRILAAAIDYGLYLLFFVVYVLYFGHNNDEGGQTVNGLAALPLPLTWFVYFVVLESIFGATPGHLALNLKVLTVDRKEIGFSKSFKRHLMDFFDFFFFAIPAIINIKNSEKHQRLGDMWAQTIVIDKMDPQQNSITPTTSLPPVPHT